MNWSNTYPPLFTDLPPSLAPLPTFPAQNLIAQVSQESSSNQGTGFPILDGIIGIGAVGVAGLNAAWNSFKGSGTGADDDLPLDQDKPGTDRRDTVSPTSNGRNVNARNNIVPTNDGSSNQCILDHQVLPNGGSMVTVVPVTDGVIRPDIPTRLNTLRLYNNAVWEDEVEADWLTNNSDEPMSWKFADDPPSASVDPVFINDLAFDGASDSLFDIPDSPGRLWTEVNGYGGPIYNAVEPPPGTSETKTFAVGDCFFEQGQITKIDQW